MTNSNRNEVMNMRTKKIWEKMLNNLWNDVKANEIEFKCKNIKIVTF